METCKKLRGSYANRLIINGRGEHCLRVGGLRIDKAVAEVFLNTITPAGVEASLQAEEQFEAEYQTAIQQLHLQVEKVEYEAKRAERQYHSVEPENRLVARTLEAEWEQELNKLVCARSELKQHKQESPGTLTDEQLERLQTLGSDLKLLWNAPTISDRDRKELLNLLLEEVNIRLEKSEKQNKAHLIVRWKGGAITELNVELRPPHQPTIQTDEKTIDLLCRLARHYDDATIAGILNRQGRRTARGERFNANRVGNLRRYRKIVRCKQSDKNTEGELVTVAKAADILGMAPSTIHRWLIDGFITGDQLTPGAPWRIRMNDELKSKFVEETPVGFVTMQEATRILGVSRQTVLQRVKLGKLEAVHICRGKRKGLRIKVLDDQPTLFNHFSSKEV